MPKDNFGDGLSLKTMFRIFLAGVGFFTLVVLLGSIIPYLSNPDATLFQKVTAVNASLLALAGLFIIGYQMWRS